MSRKIITYTILALAGIGFIGASTALAHGFGFGWGMGSISLDELTARHQQMFEHQAKILGISVDEVKNAWAENKNMSQLIKERGLDINKIQERARELRLEQIKTQLQNLVSKGVITQAQADKKLQSMQNQQNIEGKMGFKMGMRKGFWRF